MLRHKNIDRICCWVLVCVLLTAISYVGAGASGLIASERSIGYEKRLFDTGRVHTLDIVMDDWEGFLSTCTNEEYAACHVVIDGESYKNVAIRAKGNTSLSSVRQYGNNRYSFKIEFDHYQPGKSYHGLDKLSLNNLIQDNTLMKDYFAYTLMRKGGAAAPLCSYVQISVNGEPWGLYLAVEGVEDGFLRRNYGTDAGELYKPDSLSFGGGRGNGKGFDMENFRQQMEQHAQSTGTGDASNPFGFPWGTDRPDGTASPSHGSGRPDATVDAGGEKRPAGDEGGDDSGEMSFPDWMGFANGMTPPEGGFVHGAAQSNAPGEQASEVGDGDTQSVGTEAGADAGTDSGTTNGVVPGADHSAAPGEMDFPDWPGFPAGMTPPEGGFIHGAMESSGSGEQAAGNSDGESQSAGDDAFADSGDAPSEMDFPDWPGFPAGMTPPEGGFIHGAAQSNAPGEQASEADDGDTQSADAASDAAPHATPVTAPNWPGFPAGMGFGDENHWQNRGMGNADVMLQYIDDDPDSYGNIFGSAKTDITEADKQRLVQSLKKLSQGDASVVDTEAMLRYLAVHSFLCNGDSYTGSMVHNYYLYEKDGIMSMLPWDYNLAFGSFSMGGSRSGATGSVNQPIDSPVTGGDINSRPMVAWVFDSEETIQRYHQIYGQFISDAIDSGWFDSELERVRAMIAPYVESDPTAFCTSDAFQTGADTLKQFVTLRARSVSGQLAGSIPSTTEGQQSSDALIDASQLNLSAMGTMGSMGGGQRSNRTNEQNDRQTGNAGRDRSQQPSQPAASLSDAAASARPAAIERIQLAAARPGDSSAQSWLWLGVCALLLAAALVFVSRYRSHL